MKRIHIVGCGPRSGTTLLTEAMIACFEIDLYTNHEDRIYTLPSRQTGIYLTKAPQDILLVEPVLRFMTNLHVIYMLRDPRDMIVSRHNKDPDHYWSGLSFWKTYSPYGRELESHPRFITVRYEDLVAKPDQVQNCLMERLPFLKRRTKFSCYHELARPSERSLSALKSVRPISSSSIGNWLNHLPRIAGQLKQHGSITKDLIFYGYEKDGEWEKMLEGIEPDLNESHWPEYFTKKDFKEYLRLRNLKAVYAALGHSKLYIIMKILGELYRKLKSYL